MSRIRLLIVDDHEVVRLGLKTLLGDEPDLEVVAEAGSAEQALIQVKNSNPDVVIMDIQLPGAKWVGSLPGNSGEISAGKNRDSHFP